MPLVSVSLYKSINDNQVQFTFDLSLLQTNSEDNNGDFRKSWKGVRLENGAEILLTSAFVY